MPTIRISDELLKAIEHATEEEKERILCDAAQEFVDVTARGDRQRRLLHVMTGRTLRLRAEWNNES